MSSMPLLRPISPILHDRMPKTFEDRQAIAQLKMHLLMARVRTGLRVVMDRGRTWKIPNWPIYMQEELVCIFT